MATKVLPFNPHTAPQERTWDCGPAATQVLLDTLGIKVSENELIKEIGTDEDGTDFVGLIERYLDRRLPQAGYTSVYIENDPPSDRQKESLWANLTRSVKANYPVIVNWVSPPGNRPRAIKGSKQPNYGWNTVWHYVCLVGFSDDGERAVFIADPGFAPFDGYWIPFDGPGSLCSLIPPKGYCYATVVAQEINPSRLPSRDENALAIINEGRRSRSGEGQLDHPVMSERGITIAIATALVESNLRMYANNGDPESLKFPHDAISSDYNSTGLFQQRAQWWGTVEDRMNPARSAALFYNALSKLPYNDTSKTPGSFAQKVQQSAFPGRYDEKYAEAEEIYRRLSKSDHPTTSGEESMAQVPQEQWDAVYRELTKRLPSRSPLRHVGEREVDTWAGMDLNQDANLHVLLVKSLAEIGDKSALALLAEVAGVDVGKHPERAADANLAKRILAWIESTNPKALTNYLKGI